MDQEEPVKKKRGRKPGQQLVSREGRKHRFYSHSVSEQIRERVDPSYIVNWFNMIAAGKSPMWVLDKNKDVIGITENTSPNATAPTLREMTDAVRELLTRRDGMAPQVHQINAMLQATVQPELPQGLMESMNPQALVYLTKMLELVAPSDNSDAIDAEFTETKEETKPND